MSQTSKNPSLIPNLSPLVLLLVALMATAGLAACGNGSDASSDAPTESAGLAAEPDTVEDPSSVGTVSLPESEADAEEQIAAYEKELDLRERELALKEKELELKERELAQQRRGSRPQPPPRTETPVAAAPEPAPEPAEPTREEPAAPEPEPEPEPKPVETWLDVPAGREMDVEFLTHVASNTSREGDTFRTRILDPIYAGNGELAIPSGSEVVGYVVEARTNDQRIGGRSRLVLEFTDLVLPSGATVPVQASFAEEGESSKKKDAATIGGAAAAGAILGKILGGDDKEVILGAILGGAAGTAIASRNKGENVEIPEGYTVRLVLDEPVAVRVLR